eukprot:364111-Pyramimonas_sp.AAC.1
MDGASLKGKAFGPLPGHEQSVPRAELFAILKVLQVGRAPLDIKSDHLPAIEGINLRGREWCLDVSRQNLDIWRQIWRAIDGHGGLQEDVLSFSWVKSHQTGWSAEKVGNDFADQAARKGMETHA